MAREGKIWQSHGNMVEAVKVKFDIVAIKNFYWPTFAINKSGRTEIL